MTGDSSVDGAARADVDRVRDHFAARLAASTLEHSPFPHLIVADSLPGDIYARVLAENPFRSDPGEAYGDPAWTTRLNFDQRYDRRFQHDLSTLRSGVWGVLGEAFADGRWWWDLLVTRYPEYFSLRFGDAVGLDDVWERLERKAFVQRHEPGFELAAHTDIPTRVATAIFSFADRDGFDECGTQLLAPLDPYVRCWGNSHHPMDGFRVVGVAPYRPNHCLVFFKTRHSWHAVSGEAHRAPNGRFGMQVQMYERGDGVFTDLSTPDLLRNRQFLADGPQPWTLGRIARGVRRRVVAALAPRPR